MQPSTCKTFSKQAAQLSRRPSGRALTDYLVDKLLRLAVERCFEIVGEALRRLDEHDHETAAKLTDYRRIIAFRNILIHGYSLVKHDLVWSVVQNQLPKLLSEVQAILDQR